MRSDDEAVGDDDKLREAKVEVYEALGRYIDGWSTTRGNVITKFVCIVETIDSEGARTLVEVNGYAGDTSLMAWDRSGLLFESLHDPVRRMRYDGE